MVKDITFDIDSMLTVEEIKDQYKEKVKEKYAEVKVEEKKVRFFLCGKELKNEYKIGAVYKHNKLSEDTTFVISVMLI